MIIGCMLGSEGEHGNIFYGASIDIIDTTVPYFVPTPVGPGRQHTDLEGPRESTQRRKLFK